jgi:hypothetical protein
MKEPKRIKLNPENPTHKEVVKYPLKTINVTGQDNDDNYISLDLDKINKLLDETNENNSQNN